MRLSTASSLRMPPSAHLLDCPLPSHRQGMGGRQCHQHMVREGSSRSSREGGQRGTAEQRWRRIDPGCHCPEEPGGTHRVGGLEPAPLREGPPSQDDTRQGHRLALQDAYDGRTAGNLRGCCRGGNRVRAPGVPRPLGELVRTGSMEAQSPRTLPRKQGHSGCSGNPAVPRSVPKGVWRGPGWGHRPPTSPALRCTSIPCPVTLSRVSAWAFPKTF